MRSGPGIVSILLLLAPECLAANCRTCRNAECHKEYVEFRECTRFSSILPLETYPILPKIREQLQYGCLKLEYPNGKSREIIQKCIITKNIDTFCQNIAKSVSYTRCHVAQPIELNIRREPDRVPFQQINFDDPESIDHPNQVGNVIITDEIDENFPEIQFIKHEIPVLTSDTAFTDTTSINSEQETITDLSDVFSVSTALENDISTTISTTTLVNNGIREETPIDCSEEELEPDFTTSTASKSDIFDYTTVSLSDNSEYGTSKEEFSFETTTRDLEPNSSPNDLVYSSVEIQSFTTNDPITHIYPQNADNSMNDFISNDEITISPIKITETTTMNYFKNNSETGSTNGTLQSSSTELIEYTIQTYPETSTINDMINSNTTEPSTTVNEQSEEITTELIVSESSTVDNFYSSTYDNVSHNEERDDFIEEDEDTSSPFVSDDALSTITSDLASRTASNNLPSSPSTPNPLDLEDSDLSTNVVEAAKTTQSNIEAPTTVSTVSEAAPTGTIVTTVSESDQVQTDPSSQTEVPFNLDDDDDDEDSNSAADIRLSFMSSCMWLFIIYYVIV